MDYLFFKCIIRSYYFSSAANSCPTSPRGGHNRHTFEPDLQMAYGAAVTNPDQIGVIAAPTSCAIYVEDK